MTVVCRPNVNCECAIYMAQLLRLHNWHKAYTPYIVWLMGHKQCTCMYKLFISNSAKTLSCFICLPGINFTLPSWLAGCLTAVSHTRCKSQTLTSFSGYIFFRLRAMVPVPPPRSMWTLNSLRSKASSIYLLVREIFGHTTLENLSLFLVIFQYVEDVIVFRHLLGT